MSSNQLRAEVSVVKTSDPPPSDDELLLHQWIAELHSFIHMEAVRDSTHNFEEAWFSAICKIKAPKFKNVSFLKTREIDSNDLKSSCFHVWSKTVETIGKC